MGNDVMKKNNQLTKLYFILIHCALLVFLIYFFAYATPLIIYDGDDWLYLGEIRLPIPMYKAWNPTRVFPEVFMPIVGYIGATIVFPIIDDYVFSITIISSIVLSLFILGMCIAFYGVCRRRYNFSLKQAMILEIVFLSLFFLIFRNRSESRMLFSASDFTCVFFYTMSGILNAIVVLYMMRYENFGKAFINGEFYSCYNRNDKIKVAFNRFLFLFALYFALLSNLFHSCITAIYCGVEFLVSLIGFIRSILNNEWDDTNKKTIILVFIKNNIYYFNVVILYFIVLFLEKTGGRQGTFENTMEIMVSIRQLYALINAMSPAFVIVGVHNGPLREKT